MIDPTKGWIGVDLDCTLAFYEGWQWDKIGNPIPKMVARVKRWLELGYEVRVFTARVASVQCRAQQRSLITAWCQEHIGVALVVTCCKDAACLALWDDRAIQVEPNTGNPVGDVNEL